MNTNYMMENHELILALLQKYRPGHSYETVTNEQGVVELILPTDKEPLPLPLDASAKWSDVKKVFDFYEIYIAKTAKPTEASANVAEASANVAEASANAAEASANAAEAEASANAAEASANAAEAEASANAAEAEASAAI